jgi:two-component system response regulator NreC
MTPRILLADDHRVVREGLQAVLERGGFEVIGQAADGWSAIALAERLQPDVVLMDVSMPLLNGLDAAREILAANPQARIVLLTVHVDELYVIAALRAGVRGYVVKTQTSTELLDAIAEVLADGTFLSPRVAGTLVRAFLSGQRQADDRLTLREREVLQLVAEGHTTKDVAAALQLTVKTAEYYRARVMSKLSIHSTAELVKYAVRIGIVTLST